MPTVSFSGRRPWLRALLLCVLAVQCAAALLSGWLLVLAAGRHRPKFFLGIGQTALQAVIIPGATLIFIGAVSLGAFLAVLGRFRYHRIAAAAAVGLLAAALWTGTAILGEVDRGQLFWVFLVLLGVLALAGMEPVRTVVTRRTLLGCGMLASVLYVVTNLAVANQWNGYHPASQTISELSAIGAPTRALWNALCAPYSLLMIAFSAGVVGSAPANRRLHAAGDLLFAYGLLSMLWPLAPMHLRAVLAAGGATVSDTFHLLLGAITELICLLALGLAGLALGRAFRWYSFATAVALLVFGTLTFLAAPGIAADRPTPFIGIWERIDIAVFLFWVIVLAIRLW